MLGGHVTWCLLFSTCTLSPDPTSRIHPERLVLWARMACDAGDDVIATSGVFIRAGGGGGGGGGLCGVVTCVYYTG